MKKSFSFLFVLIAFSFTGCDKSDNPTKVTRLLSLTVDPTYFGYDDNWIIVQSESGKLLEYKKFEVGDSFILTTTKKVSGSTMGVTILKHKPKIDGDKKLFELYTYLNLAIGMDIKLGPVVPVPNYSGATTGNFSFTVENCPPVDNIVMSNKFTRICGSWQNYLSEQRARVDCETVTNTNKYLFQMTDASGNIKYKILEGVTPGGNYTSDYSALSDFDQTVNFTFPPTDNAVCIVDAREPGQNVREGGFALNFHFHSHLLSSFKTGYLNSLPNVRTYLFLSYPTFNYYYNNVGAVPDGNITWPSKADFTINNESLQNFSSTVPSSFKHRRSSWAYPLNPATVASWSVSSTSKNHTLADLPAELSDLYPTLILDDFQYSTSDFSVGENTRTYAQVIETTLEGSDDFSGSSVGIIIK